MTKFFYPLIPLIPAAVVFTACSTDPNKRKISHLRGGEAYAKFRAALHMTLKNRDSAYRELLAAELAFLYLEHSGDDVALSLAQSAKQKMPYSPITADALGGAFYKLGSPASAITQLKESTGKAPNNPIYHYHLGMAYMASRRADLAAQALRSALKTGPNFRYAASARGSIGEPPETGA